MVRSSIVPLARDVIAVSRERQLGVASAGLAYHAFNALVPLAILLLVGVAVSDALALGFEAVERAVGVRPGTAQRSLEGVTGDGTRDRLRAAIIASAILVWSGVRMFQAVNSAFADVYGARRRRSYVGVAVAVSLTVATMAVSVALVGVVGVSLSIVAGGVWLAALSPVLLFVLLLVSFLPMYYLFPEPDVSVREILPGTAFAAVSWAGLALGFRAYVVTAESVALFGVAGAVMLLLTWIYLGSLCVLLGAVYNAVRAGRVEAQDDWVPMREIWSQYA